MLIHARRTSSKLRYIYISINISYTIPFKCEGIETFGIETVVENWEKKCNNKEKCVSNVCIELMNIRDGLMHSELTINEACDLLSLLCT